MSETQILRAIMLEAPKLGCRLWRNNQGAFQDKRGIWVKFGVAQPGGSDLIGITPWIEGGRGGRFLAVEVKRPGQRPTPEQQAFIDLINDMGGIAFVAHSVEEFRSCLRSRLNS